MGSHKIAIGTVVAGAALVLTTPLTAQAAPQTPECRDALSQATEAEADYEAAKKQYDAGDTSLKEQVAEARQNADSLASLAQRVCGDQVADQGTGGKSTGGEKSTGAGEQPRGAMNTGFGAADSGGVSTYAWGAGVLSLAAAGSLVLLRRRSESES